MRRQISRLQGRQEMPLTQRAQATTGRHYASARIEYLSALARLTCVMGEDPGELCAPLTEPIEER